MNLIRKTLLIFFILSVSPVLAEEDPKPVTVDQAIKEYNQWFATPQGLKVVVWKLYVIGRAAKRINAGTLGESSDYLVGHSVLEDKKTRKGHMEYDRVTEDFRLVSGDYLMTRLVEKKKDAHLVYLKLSQVDSRLGRLPEGGEVVVVRGEPRLKYPDKGYLFNQKEKPTLVLDVDAIQVLPGENYLKYKDPKTPLDLKPKMFEIPLLRPTPTRGSKNDQ